MPSFTSLPPEILLQIADTLPHLHTVNALSQTSHYLHCLLSPYLYRCALTHDHGQGFVTSCLRKNDPITRRLIAEAAHLKDYWRTFHTHWKRWQSRALLRLLVAREQHQPITPAIAHDLLSTAIWNRDPLAVELLLDWHADALPTKPANLMHQVIDREEPRIVQLLIARGFPIDVPDAAGWTPLMTAVWRGRLASLQLLLDAGASVAVADPAKGCSPLAWALLQDRYYLENILQPDAQIRVVRLLLDRGSDPNASDKQGHTPLHLAVQGPARGLAVAQRGPCWPAVRLLLDAGADFATLDEPFRRSVFVDACEAGETAVVQRLLHTCRDAVRFDGPALAAAARAGHECVLDALLTCQANPNTTDQWHTTPLVYALREQRLPVVRTLLEHGADANAVAEWLETPVRRGLSDREGDMLRLLLEHGLDLRRYDGQVKSKILHEAVNSGHRVVVKMLVDLGVEVDAWMVGQSQARWRPLGDRDRCCTQPRTVT